MAEKLLEIEVGMLVQERDGGLSGQVVERGVFDDEWRIRVLSGEVVLCLGENLCPLTQGEWRRR